MQALYPEIAATLLYKNKSYMNKQTEEQQTVIRESLFVKHKAYLSPNYIRITLTGEGVTRFGGLTPGANNKIFIPPLGIDTIFFPEFDFESKEWIHPPQEVRPVVRTYTHRSIDLLNQEMVIDFIAHGVNSPASSWAINARPGDPLGVAMKNRNVSLYKEADWYLFAVDATGLPVLSVILEQLPTKARGVAFVEVKSREDQIDLNIKADIDIQWIYSASPGESTPLAKAIRTVNIPDKTRDSRYGFFAAEYSTVKDIRSYLQQEQSWDKEELKAVAYWKYGVSEDKAVR